MPGHAREFEHMEHDVDPLVAELAISQARLEEKLGSLADKFSTLIDKLDPMIALVAQHEKDITIFKTERSLFKTLLKPAILLVSVVVALASGYKIHDLVKLFITP